MLIEIGIIAALIILLITILIVLKKRKICSSKETLKSESKTLEPESIKNPGTATQADDKVTVNTEIAATNTQVTAAKEEKNKDIGNLLPQDSILRRHYLAHLCSMIEALTSPRPTESVLCRHYDMIFAVKIAQCLSDKKATERLISDYEKLRTHY